MTLFLATPEISIGLFQELSARLKRCEPLIVLTLEIMYETEDDYPGKQILRLDLDAWEQEAKQNVWLGSPSNAIDLDLPVKLRCFVGNSF